MEEPASKTIFKGSYRQGWSDLMPEILELIFCELSFKELLTVMPCVCKSWEKFVKGPYCWRDIDIEEWSDQSTPEKVDRMVQMLVSRSGKTLRNLSVSKVHSDSVFSCIADNADSLEMLRLNNCNITDEVIVQTAEKFSCLTTIDLSGCWRIGARALEAIGKNYHQLSSFTRIMDPLDIDMDMDMDMEPLDMDTGIHPKAEARVIADTMQNLKLLSFGYEGIGRNVNQMIENEDVFEIIEKCQNLEFLDVCCCWNVSFNSKEFKVKFPEMKVGGMTDCFKSCYNSSYNSCWK